MTTTGVDRGVCPPPFFQDILFTDGGFVDGRLCQTLPGSNITCCLPCPLTDWVYPDSFDIVQAAAGWVAVGSTALCVFVMLSWAILPPEKTHRHYLSICMALGVLMMALGFVVPLAAKPDQCFDEITPRGMATSQVCAASGALVVLGGWVTIVWAFLRSLSLHLQICWQVVVGRPFMWFSMVFGWGIPIAGIIVALTLSGVSFRFGNTCHINHKNSLADFWIPLLVFAAVTIILQAATLGYCIRVYLASLADNNASTENSGLPSYTNSLRTMTPRMAYRRVRRVIQLQWRGIAIVLIIIVDVIFFSVVFVFQDNTVEHVKDNPLLAESWIGCLLLNPTDKTKCLSEAASFVVPEATAGAVLFLLAMNGFWVITLLAQWSVVTAWADFLFRGGARSKREFVSADARLEDVKKDTRSYEMLSRDSGRTMLDAAVDVKSPRVISPLMPAAQSPPPSRASQQAGPPSLLSRAPSTTTSIRGGAPAPGLGPGAHPGRRTPDYFGPAARYQPPVRSFSNPRPPPRSPEWDARETYAPSGVQDEKMNPLGMNRI